MTVWLILHHWTSNLQRQREDALSWMLAAEALFLSLPSPSKTTPYHSAVPQRMDFKLLKTHKSKPPSSN